MPEGIYFDGEGYIPCTIIRQGAKNTRIELRDGGRPLVPSRHVTAIANNDMPEEVSRIIPTIPLEMLYRKLRKLKGGRNQVFLSLQQSLSGRYGAKDSQFLGELFRRSVAHSAFYANPRESFYLSRPAMTAGDHRFARRLLEKLDSERELVIGDFRGTYVDYEIFPYRTTRSCRENGQPAKSAGAGGIDLLFASSSAETVLPVIGEIKARTEGVGPTFALIQSLMYCAQMLSQSQFSRLKYAYSDSFSRLVAEKPRAEIALFIEPHTKLNKMDLQYAVSLAEGVCGNCYDYLRSIWFILVEFNGDDMNGEILSMCRSSRAGEP